jgi:hypothetical protein
MLIMHTRGMVEDNLTPVDESRVVILNGTPTTRFSTVSIARIHPSTL